jgi:hypothetical protein
MKSQSEKRKLKKCITVELLKVELTGLGLQVDNEIFSGAISCLIKSSVIFPF